MIDWKVEYEKLVNDMDIGYVEVKDYVKPFIPEKLYRYRSFDNYYKKNIFEGQVYLAHPDTYNDPYDSAVKLDYYECMKCAVKVQIGRDISSRTSYEKLVRDNVVVRNEIAKHYDSTVLGFKRYVKIACFAENNDNMLMWSHYAKYHSGYCIEYDTRKNDFFDMLLLPVIYSKERYDATPCFVTKSPNIAINPVLYKSDEWSYEREWRIFGTTDIFKNEIDCLELPEAISAIYIGAATDNKDKEKIDDIKNWGDKNNVKINKMRLNHNKYKLEYEPI